ncbi:type I-F CRISPR-associated helicase Cas3f [Acetobacter sp. AAB5]|uniref:type I-F CRISPR-associated helicase Cas3f n=1 Tax=Acetobacter sp. AAB5 TaxID=3418370 RepID=UPI003CE85CF7
MNILLISQCDKRALTETRRILDQFAQRKGARTWQTRITEQGLETLRVLLRSTARRNTAVACHKLTGASGADVLWFVGDRSRFDEAGNVPTNTTVHDILRTDDETTWRSKDIVLLLSQMAGLFHDLGKGSKEFQDKLRARVPKRSPYRHEWISVRMLAAFVGDSDNDRGWLERLADAPAHADRWTDPAFFVRDDARSGQYMPFSRLPPLAASVAWLIVSHHRLPLVPVMKGGRQEWLGKEAPSFSLSRLTKPLSEITAQWNSQVHDDDDPDDIEACWRMAGKQEDHPVYDRRWGASARRFALKAIEMLDRDGDVFGKDAAVPQDAYVLYLARLSLMLADHHHSSLPWTGKMSKVPKQTLFANTDNKGCLKEPLTDHLLGVARAAGQVTYALSSVRQSLPAIRRHRGLRKRSSIDRFRWQDIAVDEAHSLRVRSEKGGAFIVCMASTGCGKTIANAKIVNALSNERNGLRLTYALGLRSLTLQTGEAYRKEVGFAAYDLAILVGGIASRALFEHYADQAAASGSESTQSIMDKGYVVEGGCESSHPVIGRLVGDKQSEKLLASPVVVCTVDHIVPATESLRGGRHIIPAFRLMTSDLVIDELDDYDLSDMPALTRLVHLAGLLGARVILSSATLPPAMVEGMYEAYQIGRKCYDENHGQDGSEWLGVSCMWVDEFSCISGTPSDVAAFLKKHEEFVSARASELAGCPALRVAETVPLDISAGSERHEVLEAYAKTILTSSLRMHERHAGADPATGCRVSFGLVRMANVEPVFDVARILFRADDIPGVRVHLCVYHSRFPLAHRAAIENMLDRSFTRKKPNAVFSEPEIRAAIDAAPDKEHIFIVLASPVCEVGRDWDADWAVIEPSSVRSVIQLAGRVQRHRRLIPVFPNMAILDMPVRAILKPSEAAFCRPGFEGQQGEFRLATHHVHNLLNEGFVRHIDARPRICPPPRSEWHSTTSLADLEQAAVVRSMVPAAGHPSQAGGLAPSPEGSRRQRFQAGSKFRPAKFMSYLVWKFPQALMTGLLQQQQPFRASSGKDVTLVLVQDEDGIPRLYREDGKIGKRLYVPIEKSLRHNVHLNAPHAWVPVAKYGVKMRSVDGTISPMQAALLSVRVPQCDLGWRYHPVLGFACYRGGE